MSFYSYTLNVKPRTVIHVTTGRNVIRSHVTEPAVRPVVRITTDSTDTEQVARLFYLIQYVNIISFQFLITHFILFFSEINSFLSQFVSLLCHFAEIQKFVKPNFWLAVAVVSFMPESKAENRNARDAWTERYTYPRHRARRTSRCSNHHRQHRHGKGL